MNKEELQYSIEYFDKLIIDLLNNPPEDFNIKSFGKHYNNIKNALSILLKDNE